jgi:ubiquinone/menaquinone biosynthesis C-methylase UbiE
VSAVPRSDLRASYDKSASGYDARFAALQAPKHEAVLSRLPPPAGARIGDLGGGTGLLLARLGPRTPPVLLLDLSVGMLARAPRDAARVQGDLVRLPLRDGALDVIYAVTCLLLSPRERRAALAELARVLAPGGALGLTVLRSDGDATLEAALASAGLVPGPRFECGQDVGWICRRG